MSSVPTPTVPDDCVTTLRTHRLGHKVRERRNDAALRIDGPLPTLRRPVRLGETSLGERLVPVVGHVSGRTAFDLAGVGPDLDLEVEATGEQASGLTSLAFGAADDARDRRDPGLVEHRERASPTFGAESPLGNRHVRLDDDLRVRDVAQQ